MVVDMPPSPETPPLGRVVRNSRLTTPTPSRTTRATITARANTAISPASQNRPKAIH